MITAEGKNKFQPQIRSDLCKQCGICIHFCPLDVLAPGDKGFPILKQPEKCNGCLMCFHRCPDFALEVINNEET